MRPEPCHEGSPIHRSARLVRRHSEPRRWLTASASTTCETLPWPTARAAGPTTISEATTPRLSASAPTGPWSNTYMAKGDARVSNAGTSSPPWKGSPTKPSSATGTESSIGMDWRCPLSAIRATNTTGSAMPWLARRSTCASFGAGTAAAGATTRSWSRKGNRRPASAFWPRRGRLADSIWALPPSRP